MFSRDCSIATCWKWSILAGSVREKTPPTPALASASVIWPSESSCTCCSFSLTVIRFSRASTRRSTDWLAVGRAGWRASSSGERVAASTLLPTKVVARTVAATVPIRVNRFMVCLPVGRCDLRHTVRV